MGTFSGHSICELSNVPNHVHLDGDRAAVPKRHLRDLAHLGLLDFSANRADARSSLHQKVQALHHPPLRLLSLQSVLLRSSPLALVLLVDPAENSGVFGGHDAGAYVLDRIYRAGLPL